MKSAFLSIFLVASAAAQTLSVSETAKEILVKNGDKLVMTYHKTLVPPPPEADPIFERSGFIHPLCAPAGGVVTGIHPQDHYHHLGLWHAWVHGEHEGKPTDFWNLKDRTGRVQFVKTLEKKQQDGMAGFVVQQEQLRYRDGKGGDPLVILREELTVMTRMVEGAYEIDYNIQQMNVSEHALVLPAYRYGGGIAYRAPLDWDETNSDYLTSEGKTRKDSHTTRAKWVAMFGPTDKGAASVTVLCHPQNHDAPQHVRTWDNGKIFLNYVPIQETGWEIKAGETITLRYRVVIADGKAEAGTLETRWERYAKK